MTQGMFMHAGRAFTGALVLFVLCAPPSACGRKGPLPSPDKTPPRVSFTSPAAGAQNVAVDAAVSITFSEPMNPSTITDQSIGLTRNNVVVPGSVRYADPTALFQPAQALAPDANYIVTVGSAVKDAAGNRMEEPYSFFFVTGSLPDTTRPRVVSTDPKSNATGVGLNASISVTFSEVMAADTVALHVARNGVDASGTLSYPGTSVVFTPSAEFAPDAVYEASVPASAEDPAGNSLGTDYLWSFRTGSRPDREPPAVVSMAPQPGSTNVDIDSAVIVSFSEAMDANTLTTETIRLSGPKGAEVPGTVVPGRMTAAFTPLASLEPQATHFFMVTTGVKDLAGNPLAESWLKSFTTGSVPDRTAPLVTEVTPGVSAEGVEMTTAVSVQFSEAVREESIGFLLSAGSGTVPCVLEYYSGQTALFRPADRLTVNTLYTARVFAGVEDLSGNVMASDYFWSFRTGDKADTRAPEVAAHDPAVGATGVGIATSVTVTFSEPVKEPSVVFELRTGATASPCSLQQPFDGITAVFLPEEPLAYDSLYTARVSAGVTDLSDNVMASDYFWSFTTGHRQVYAIEASAGAGGSIFCDPPSVNYGGSSVCAIAADAGRHIVDVQVNGVSIGAASSYTFTNVIADQQIAARFEPDTFTVTASAGAGGTAACAPAVVEYGGTSVCTITPDEGYEIADVSVDGVGQGPVASYTFAAVTGNHALEASFAVLVYVVTPVVTGGNGAIDPAVPQTVSHGSFAVFVLTPDSGFYAHATGCGGVLDNTIYTTGPVTGPCTVEANFTE